MSQCVVCDKTLKTGMFASYEDLPSLRDATVCRKCSDQIAREGSEDEVREARLKQEAISETAKTIVMATTDSVPEGMEIIGIARGSTARAKNAISDFGAGLKNVVGGEVVTYTKLIADAREQALQRMAHDAARLGAEMVVGVRFTSTTIDVGISEIAAYGTALKGGVSGNE